MESEHVSEWLGAQGPTFVPKASRKGRAGLAQELGLDSDNKADSSTFGKAMETLSSAAADPQRSAAEVVAGYARGSEGPMHEGALALEKSDIAFKFMVTAKNKAIEAYKETMRMGG